MPGPLPKYPIKLTPEQEARLQHLSTCYTAPFAAVQQARLLSTAAVPVETVRRRAAGGGVCGRGAAPKGRLNVLSTLLRLSVTPSPERLQIRPVTSRAWPALPPGAGALSTRRAWLGSGCP